MLFTNRMVNDGYDQAKKELFTLVEALYFQEIKNIREQKTFDDSEEESKRK